MTATMTKLSTRHSWDKEPRRDDPDRHIYTCRRDVCGLMKRSELVDGEWLEFWRWPDGEEGQDRKAPACRAGQVTEMSPESVPVESATGKPCARCVPPLPHCGRPARLYAGGWMCDEQAAAAGRARAGAA